MAEKKKLTIKTLCSEAATFAKEESACDEPSLYGATDGKTIGTHLERKFVERLQSRYSFGHGSSSIGIDIPELDVDIKVTSVRQPQSSCPFESARQKIYGLGYHLIIFAYEKSDNHETRTGRLDIRHAVFIEKHRTADFQMTSGLRQIVENEGNEDDVVAFLQDKNLPVDDIEARSIAKAVLKEPPLPGCLTISNALQWRLQYSRALAEAGEVSGVERIR